MGAYLAHLPGELSGRVEQAGIFKIPEHLMPVLDGVDVLDLLVEQRDDQLALFPLAGDGLDDLVQVQVSDVSAAWLFRYVIRLRRRREQQAGGHETLLSSPERRLPGAISRCGGFVHEPHRPSI